MSVNIIYPELKPWQRAGYDFIKDSPHKEKVLVIKSKRQVGKNFLANAILLNYCSYGLTNCLLEPTIPQARRAYYQMVKLLQGSNIIKSANASTLIIEFINGAEILYKSAGQQLAGFTISGVAIIDEVVYLPEDDIDTFLPTCDAQKANIVYISTPMFASGRFYEEFTNPEPNKLILDWNEWDTSEFLSKEKLEIYRKKLSPNKFKTEYLAQFITVDGLLFTNLNECTGTPSNQNKIFVGIDWATGSNGDYTSIVGMNDWRVLSNTARLFLKSLLIRFFPTAFAIVPMGFETAPPIIIGPKSLTNPNRPPAVRFWMFCLTYLTYSPALNPEEPNMVADVALSSEALDALSSFLAGAISW